jgi:hypothetical protein
MILCLADQSITFTLVLTCGFVPYIKAHIECKLLHDAVRMGDDKQTLGITIGGPVMCQPYSTVSQIMPGSCQGLQKCKVVCLGESQCHQCTVKDV